MNMIIDKLPYSVKLKNKIYKVNVDYRLILDFEEKMQDSELSNSDKIIIALQNFYPAFFDILNNGLLKEALEKFIWFYRCGNEEPIKETPSKLKNASPVYSYSVDAKYIFAAFWHDYRIDLTKDFVHWWKFKAFFMSLSSENEFIKIQSYRSYNGDDEKILALKKHYELPLSKKEKEIIDELEKLLARKD